jgi:hypothetical protein
MKQRIFALVALLILLCLVARHTKAQNFAGIAGAIYTNVTVTGSNPGACQMILARIPDGVIPNCVTFGVLTNGSTAPAMIVYGTNNVTGGGTPVSIGTAVAFCSPPHWQFPFYSYLPFSGTAIVSIAFTSLTNAP